MSSLTIQRVGEIYSSFRQAPTALLTLTQLFIYPVKSLPPVQVSSVELTNEGLRFDRSFVLVNPPKDDSRRAKFLTIKKVYKLALFKPTIVSTLHILVWGVLNQADIFFSTIGQQLDETNNPSYQNKSTNFNYCAFDTITSVLFDEQDV